jgi:hypothetical protein
MSLETFVETPIDKFLSLVVKTVGELKKWLEDVPDDTPFIPQGDDVNCLIQVALLWNYNESLKGDPTFSERQEQVSLYLENYNV